MPEKDKITTSSYIPGYDYKKGSSAHFWHSHMIGQEWMRIDFIKPTRVTGFQVGSIILKYQNENSFNQGTRYRPTGWSLLG